MFVDAKYFDNMVIEIETFLFLFVRFILFLLNLFICSS